MDEVKRNSWWIRVSARREFSRGCYCHGCFRKYEVSDYVMGKTNLQYFSRTALLNQGTFTPVGYVIYIYIIFVRDRSEVSESILLTA